MEKLNCPNKKIDIVIDTDTFNEIDDQFAISYAFASQNKLNIKAIYAAPFTNLTAINPKIGMELSYNEINKLLRLMNNENFIEVYKGSTEYMRDENTPVISDAANHLANLAMNYSEENPLYVVELAAITTVASAILINKEIAKRIVVVFLGGNTHDYPSQKEFNLSQDIDAANVVLSNMSGRMVQVPCFGCVSEFSISKFELEYFLRDKNPLSNYLIDAVIDYKKNAKETWSKPIWDVCAIAWLLNDNNIFMKSIIKSIPTYTKDEKISFVNDRGNEVYVYKINRENLFNDLFVKLSNISNLKYIK